MKKEERKQKIFTSDELAADYRVALDEIGGRAGVNRLIQSWSGKISQQFRPQSRLSNKVRTAFTTADVDGSGEISRDEFRQAMSMLNCVLTEAQVVAVFGVLDDQLDNEIGVEGFVAQLCGLAEKDFNPSQINYKEITNPERFRCEAGEQRASLVPDQKLKERAPGRHGERQLRLASGEMLLVVPNDPYGPAWRLRSGRLATTDTHLPKYAVTAVDLAHGEVVFEVIGGNCYLSQNAAKRAAVQMQRDMDPVHRAEMGDGPNDAWAPQRTTKQENLRDDWQSLEPHMMAAMGKERMRGRTTGPGNERAWETGAYAKEAKSKARVEATNEAMRGNRLPPNHRGKNRGASNAVESQSHTGLPHPREGARVEAKHQGSAELYTGRVYRDNCDETFHVLFENGDSDRFVPLRSMRLLDLDDAPEHAGDNSTDDKPLPVAAERQLEHVRAQLLQGAGNGIIGLKRRLATKQRNSQRSGKQQQQQQQQQMSSVHTSLEQAAFVEVLRGCGMQLTEAELRALFLALSDTDGAKFTDGLDGGMQRMTGTTARERGGISHGHHAYNSDGHAPVGGHRRRAWGNETGHRNTQPAARTATRVAVSHGRLLRALRGDHLPLRGLRPASSRTNSRGRGGHRGRLELVQQAFDALLNRAKAARMRQVTRQEVVEALRSKSLRSSHPLVRSGVSTERQVEREVVANFSSSTDGSYVGAGASMGTNAGAQVQAAEWEDYCAVLSATTEGDADFKSTMRLFF
jgi:Ca2+-binding EF-hand superfamily protein